MTAIESVLVRRDMIEKFEAAFAEMLTEYGKGEIVINGEGSLTIRIDTPDNEGGKLAAGADSSFAAAFRQILQNPEVKEFLAEKLIRFMKRELWRDIDKAVTEAEEIISLAGKLKEFAPA